MGMAQLERRRRTEQQLGAAALLLRQRVERLAAAVNQPLPESARHSLRRRSAEEWVGVIA